MGNCWIREGNSRIGVRQKTSLRNLLLHYVNLYDRNDISMVRVCVTHFANSDSARYLAVRWTAWPMTRHSAL